MKLISVPNSDQVRYVTFCFNGWLRRMNAAISGAQSTAMSEGTASNWDKPSKPGGNRPSSL